MQCRESHIDCCHTLRRCVEYIASQKDSGVPGFELEKHLSSRYVSSSEVDAMAQRQQAVAYLA